MFKVNIRSYSTPATGKRHLLWLPEVKRIQHIIKCLGMENLKYCSALLDSSEENQIDVLKVFPVTVSNKWCLSASASVSLSFFKMKWVPKERKKYGKELVLTETRKINRSEKQKIGGFGQYWRYEKSQMFLEDSNSRLQVATTQGLLAAPLSWKHCNT